MAEPRFNNPYFWPPPPSMPGQLDNLVLINKIKEQLMAEKIRPLHLPPTSTPSQQSLLVPTSSPDGGATHGMPVPKPQSQQVPAHHSQPQGSGQPDIALHARPASGSGPDGNLDDKSSVKAKGLWEDWHMRQLTEQSGRINHRSGLAPSSRPDNHSTSEALTPTTLTSSSQNRMGGAPSVNIISGLASGPGMDHMKGGLAGLLGPPPKAPRGRKKIKAENTTGPLLVVPYPILADQGCVTVAPYEAHVQTHSRGAPSEPPIAAEDRVPGHPHPDLPHLSSAGVQQQDFSVWVGPDVRRPCTPRSPT